MAVFSPLVLEHSLGAGEEQAEEDHFSPAVDPRLGKMVVGSKRSVNADFIQYLQKCNPLLVSLNELYLDFS